MDREDSYEVGYGKPPAHGRFKPGTSGNPSGRKRPRKSPAVLIDLLLHEKIAVNEQGRTKRITKLEVIMRQMINKAASGDPRVLKLFLDVLRQHKPEEEAVGLSQSDEQLIADMLADYERLQGGKAS